MNLVKPATAVPGKHLLRYLLLAGLPVPSRAVSPSSIRTHARHFHPSQPRRQSALRKAPSPLSRRKPIQGLIFSQNDVPPLEFWNKPVSALAHGDLTGEVCFNAATRYCEIAIGELSTWKGRLQSEYGIDQYTLHYTALSLMGGEPGPSWRLALHMLKTASDLDYTPSTMTLVGLLTKTRPDSKASQQDLYKDILPRFDKIVRTGRNPDALTLRALLFLREQNITEALRHFDHAIKAGARLVATGTASQSQTASSLLDDSSVSSTINIPTERPPRWALEATCYLVRGQLLLKMGRESEAEASFRVAALELDTADAYLELARLLPEGMQAREEYLLKAAVSLNLEACSTLAEEEAHRAQAAEPSDPGKRDHQTKASEWFQLAGEPDRASEVRSGVVG